MAKRAEFLKDLSTYWHCEGRDRHTIADLRRALSDLRHPISMDEFQQLLDVTIRTRECSVDEYEVITGLNFDSLDDVADDLKHLQTELFGRQRA
jgi:hypothetical protein